MSAERGVATCEDMERWLEAAHTEIDRLRSVLSQVAECEDATSCPTCLGAIREAMEE